MQTRSPTPSRTARSDRSRRLYRRVIGPPADRGDLAPQAAAAVEPNAVRLLSAHSLTQLGDRIVDPKTVLPYLLAAGGAPAALVGLLVPVRESGALLPQLGLLGLLHRTPRRARLLAVSAVGQGGFVAGVATAALLLRGTALGLAVVACLAGFAVSRALSSLANKDVRGRLLPKGERGRVTGLATSISGVLAIAVGLGLRLLGSGSGTAVLGALLAGAAALWLLAALVYAGVLEPPAEAAAGSSAAGASAREALRLLRDDRPFRGFVLARTLLLVSALSPPFVVALATARTGSGAGGAGLFVVAAGVASAVGGRAWGSAADRSSRRVMALAASLASLTVLVFLGLLRTGAGDSEALFVLAYGALAVVHAGARVGRKTYVVDMAGGDKRTDQVAVANTVIGVLLLVVGAIAAGLAQLGTQGALLALAALGAAGVPAALRLPEVE